LQFRVVLILESSLHLSAVHLLLGESVVQITDLLLPIVYNDTNLEILTAGLFPFVSRLKPIEAKPLH